MEDRVVLVGCGTWHEKNQYSYKNGRNSFSGGERRRDRLRLPTPVFLSFSAGSDGKESACNVGDLGSIPGLGRSPGGGHGHPL